MIRVWMNYWFSTAVNIIELLKENDPEIYVIGSHENEFSVNKIACDEWYSEPKLDDSDYIDFCLNFCRLHGIQVFIPRKGMIKISECKDCFEKMGVRVMIDDYGMVSLLNRKERAYEFAAERNLGFVPEYFIVRNMQEFMDAYEKLSLKYEQICFKFTSDVGGKSFRLIDNQRKGYSALFKKQNTRMTLDSVLEALSEREIFAPIMIMPFLSGEEISVDCLNTEDGLIALPRVKGVNKYEIIRYDRDILDMCLNFQQAIKLECPYNIQFKYYDNVPYFLEINTRMSGGIHMACLGGGVNIPQIALYKLLGNKVSWSIHRTTKKVGQILKAVVIE